MILKVGPEVARYMGEADPACDVGAGGGGGCGASYEMRHYRLCQGSSAAPAPLRAHEAENAWLTESDVFPDIDDPPQDCTLLDCKDPSGCPYPSSCASVGARPMSGTKRVQ